jgi:hypothetical protein
MSNLGTSFISPYSEDRITNPTLQNNVVYTNSTPPIIDGDLESYTGEWENATVYIGDYGVGHKQVTIRVQANLTHLFMGISYTSSVYVPINTTIPPGDTYNNQSHSWYSVIFDRNFDSKLGSEISPDDIVVINYRVNGSQDGFMNGTKTNSFVMDVNATGFENSVSALSEYEDDFNDHVVSIEFAKELDSGDVAGNDIELKQNTIINFDFIVWENETAEYNLTTLTDRDLNIGWRTIRMETQYDYFSYIEDVEDLNVLTYITDSSDSDRENLTTINNMLSDYALNSTDLLNPFGGDPNYKFGASGLENVDLVILIGSLTDLDSDEIEALRFYVASGGSLYILADGTKRQSKVNQLLTHFGLEIYNSTLYSKNILINSSLTIEEGTIIDLPYISAATELTDQTVGDLSYKGSAIHIVDNETNWGEGYIQFQEADMYATINVTGDYYIDLDKDGSFNSTLDLQLNDSAVLQSAIEFQRGGKLIVSASADMFNASNFADSSAKYFLLRQVQWLLGFQHKISFDDFNLFDSEIKRGEEVRVNISVSGDNGSSLDDVRVWIVVQELKTEIDYQDLSPMGDDYTFNGSIVPVTTKNKSKFVEISIRMHMRGYGYNETALYEIFIDPVLGLNNDINIVA